MRAFRISVALTLLLASTAAAQTANSAATGAAATITPSAVKQRIEFLASDAMKGRDTPSPGLEAAAQYVADAFKSFGLKPAGDSGSYIQRWIYQARRLDSEKVKAVLHGNGDRTLAYGSEFFALASPGTDSMVGPIVIAKSTVPNPAWAGKFVLLPVAGDSLNQQWGNNTQAVVISAITSGAKGVVLMLAPGFGAEAIGETVGAVGNQQVPVPILGVRNDIANEWLKSSTPTVELRTALAGIDSRPPNAVGILEGSDPELKNTYIVYSAHMDHVGVGAPDARGDSIYNGADDDASGTSAVVQIAQAFSGMKQRPKRSIIFLVVSGEEKGLFGSKWFTEHTPVPTDKIVADINIDMIGRNNPDSTVAIGQEYTSLGPTVQAITKAHPELHLTVAPDLWPQEGLFFRSDHFNFAMKKIPAIFFTSGLHKDYHKPSDEPATIDNDKLARTARLLFWLGYDVANSATAPSWTPAGLKAINQAGDQ